jgi:hypothetical protein
MAELARSLGFPGILIDGHEPSNSIYRIGQHGLLGPPLSVIEGGNVGHLTEGIGLANHVSQRKDERIQTIMKKGRR